MFHCVHFECPAQVAVAKLTNNAPVESIYNIASTKETGDTDDAVVEVMAVDEVEDK